MKTIIITGANGNLGSVVTKAFLDEGYRVIATVASVAMKQDMPSHVNLEVHVVNLTNEAETLAFLDTAISKHEKIDAALLLVGGFAMGSIETTTIADIHQQLTLNFDTAYNVVRPLFKHMLLHEHGKIVFIGAKPALEAVAGKPLIAYGLSKSLLFKLAEYLNEEAKGKGVVITVIVPGTLDTALNRKNMPDVNPENWVKPSALAEILKFAVSDTASVIREPVIKVYNNA